MSDCPEFDKWWSENFLIAGMDAKPRYRTAKTAYEAFKAGKEILRAEIDHLNTVLAAMTERLEAADRLKDTAENILTELARCGEPDPERTEIYVEGLRQAVTSYEKAKEVKQD